MIKALLMVLHVGAQCPHATLEAGPGQFLYHSDVKQVHISAARCQAKYPKSPCLGKITKKATNDYTVTCVARSIAQEKNDDKTKKPLCKSCHTNKHPDKPKPSEGGDGNGTEGPQPDNPWPNRFERYIFSK